MPESRIYILGDLTWRLLQTFQVKSDDGLAGEPVSIHSRQRRFAALACPQHCDRVDFKLKPNLLQILQSIDHRHASLKIRINTSNFQYLPGNKMSIKIMDSSQIHNGVHVTAHRGIMHKRKMMGYGLWVMGLFPLPITYYSTILPHDRKNPIPESARPVP